MGEKVLLRDKLESLARNDVDLVARKDEDYGSSWKRRGGVGAFMMLARKWDRIENFVRQHGYDVFRAIEKEPTIVEDMMDLGGYLWLVRSEGMVIDRTLEEERCYPQDCDPECRGPEPDPRKKYENPYAFVPQDDDPENDEPWSRMALPDVGDTELRAVYELSEKEWFSLSPSKRASLITELRMHYNSIRTGRTPDVSTDQLGQVYGLAVRPPNLDVAANGRNSQPARRMRDA